jgi:hypothetical protein
LLQAISDFLDRQQDMVAQIGCDLKQDLKKAETGRSGLSRFASGPSLTNSFG